MSLSLTKNLTGIKGVNPGPEISGIGISLPEKIVTNNQLIKDYLKDPLGTDDEWIQQRVGVRERRFCEPGQGASFHGLKAAQNALQMSKIAPVDLDLIIVATVTPDYGCGFPSTACLIQKGLGAVNAGAVDVNAACSSLVYALNQGYNYIKSGLGKKVLVVGTEVMSSICNWHDRGTCIIFGDAAGAIVLENSGEDAFKLFDLGADGNYAELITMPGGGSRTPMTHQLIAEQANTIHMDGQAVFKIICPLMVEKIQQALKKANLTNQDIDLLIPHQANIRINEFIRKGLGVSSEKTINNIDRYGNTTSASVILCLYEALMSGKCPEGSLVVMATFGAGMTWAIVIVRTSFNWPHLKIVEQQIIEED